ncbi:MAG: response regulator [Chloroflexota bacterium]|nr:response regulator [Chloroflexota bacterium]
MEDEHKAPLATRAGQPPAWPILLIEDSATAAATIEHTLRAMRLLNPVVLATSLADAVPLLEHGLRPALVLLDYELPDGNGVDLLRTHGDREPLLSTPVIMLSAHEGADEIDDAHRLGVTAYLVKPVAYDAVQDVVRRLPLPWFLGAPEQAVP